MIILLSRGTNQTDAPSTIDFIVGMQAVFPSRCSDILSCQESFGQSFLNKIESNPSLTLKIPLVDGTTLVCHAQLISIIQNARKYKHKGDDNF